MSFCPNVAKRPGLLIKYTRNMRNTRHFNTPKHRATLYTSARHLESATFRLWSRITPFGVFRLPSLKCKSAKFLLGFWHRQTLFPKDRGAHVSDATLPDTPKGRTDIPFTSHHMDILVHKRSAPPAKLCVPVAETSATRKTLRVQKYLRPPRQTTYPKEQSASK